MDKIRFLFLSFGVAALVLLFTQCKKDHTNVIKLTCYYVSDTQDTTGPFGGVWVEVDTSRLSPHITEDYLVDVNGDTVYYSRTNYCSDDVRRAHGYTDASGSITFEFYHPLLLNFNALDTIFDESGNPTMYYSGRTELQVKDGEDVEQNIYLYPVY